VGALRAGVRSAWHGGGYRIGVVRVKQMGG